MATKKKAVASDSVTNAVVVFLVQLMDSGSAGCALYPSGITERAAIRFMVKNRLVLEYKRESIYAITPAGIQWLAARPDDWPDPGRKIVVIQHLLWTMHDALGGYGNWYGVPSYVERRSRGRETLYQLGNACASYLNGDRVNVGKDMRRLMYTMLNEAYVLTTYILERGAAPPTNVTDFYKACEAVKEAVRTTQKAS